jgi:phosphonate transport system substrate-binding protein
MYILFLGITFITLTLDAKEITIGSISINPMKMIKRMDPLAKYIAANLSDENIDKGKVLIARDAQTMARYMNEGKVDIFIESVFPALLVNIPSGCKIVLRRWKGGVSHYYSVIAAKKDIKSLEDLKGEKITFDHPYSTSGYFIPKTMMLNRGLNIIPYQAGLVGKDTSSIYYIFSNSDENTFYWVLRGVVKAGAMDEPSYNKFSKKYPDSLHIIYKSSPIPRHVVCFNNKLSPRLFNKLLTLMTEMDKSDEGKAILKSFYNTKKFDYLSREELQLMESYKEIIKNYFKEDLK